MRNSKQRDEILAVLRSARYHFSAVEVYDRVREQIPDISLGTVYRNLGKLVESGEALMLETEERAVRYDGFVQPHTHFMCEECKEIYDFPCKKITRKIDGFLIRSERTIYYGVCKKCLEKKEKEKEQ